MRTMPSCHAWRLAATPAERESVEVVSPIYGPHPLDPSPDDNDRHQSEGDSSEVSHKSNPTLVRLPYSTRCGPG
jgi:hypothetical protein